MIENIRTFTSFSVDNIKKAKEFYGNTLGIKLHEEGDMGFRLNLEGGTTIFVYPKNDHKPATFTILNFVVEDVDEAMDELSSKGVRFHHYDNDTLKQDEKGIHRGLRLGKGPDIAWFEDPAGNILSVLQDNHG